MKKIKLIAFLLILNGVAFAQDLPTASQIFENYVTAVGGKDAV